MTTFRPPFVHGPRQPFYREQFFWDRMRDGRPIILPDGGDTPMPWVFVSDLADACVRALDVPEAAGEAFNIAHVEPLTQRDFVAALGRAAGATPTFVAISRAEIHAAGGHPMTGHLYFGEALDLPPHTAIIDKAPRVLGVTPTPLERPRDQLRLVAHATGATGRLLVRRPAAVALNGPPPPRRIAYSRATWHAGSSRSHSRSSAPR